MAAPNGNGASPLLRVEHLCAWYGEIQAVDDVSLHVHANESVFLIGANGAGKSTCLMSISGIVRRRTGTIELNGRDLSSAPAFAVARAGITQVPEGRRLFASLTVEDNLRSGGFWRPSQLRQRLEPVYQTFPILHARRRQLAGNLSGGEQQMLAIGRALMAQPSVLLLDEPSLGLAPVVVETIYETIRSLRSSGMGIVLVEQNATLALDVCDRGYVMSRGRVLLSGTAAELGADRRLEEAYLQTGVGDA